MNIIIEEENYRLLGDLVVNFATREVQKIFFARYENLTKEPWGQKHSSGKQFFETRTPKDRRQMYSNLSDEDRQKLDGDACNWDITMLDKVLSNIDLSAKNTALKDQHDEENRHIKSIKRVRNKYSHRTQKQIPQVEFEDFWEEAKTALVALGSSESKIDQIKASRIGTSFKLFESPTKNFTGRKELLQTVHNHLLECSTKNDCLDRIVVLSGLGGIGKSELARMYAKTYIQDRIIQNVAWIDAEKLTSIKASFVSLANKLRIPTENMELEEIVEEVYDHFSNHIHNGLFIFDNVRHMKDGQFEIYDYLPMQESLQQRPLLLLTTQDSEWSIPIENVINITELSREESIELLQTKFRLARENTNYDDYKKLVAKLAAALQGYPLGLALATSNIKSNKNWTGLQAEIERYLERMEEPSGGWIGDDQHRAATKYKLIMENVWEVTLEKIQASDEGEDAINLLNIIAYFPPDEIEKLQIEQIFKNMYSAALQSKLFHLLENFSLLKVETREELSGTVTHLIRIHRLIQLTTRDKLDRKNQVSYLFRLCEYFCYTGYSEDDYRAETQETMIGLHNFLRDRKWPQASIQFSFMFCSIMTGKGNVKYAFDMSQDLHTFINLDEPKQAILFFGKDVINLFWLCIFWINQNGMRGKFILNKEKLATMFISMVQPSTAFALTSTTGPKSLQEHLHILCLRLVLDFIELNTESTKQLIPMIVSALNGTRCSSAQHIAKVYLLLWTCLGRQVPQSMTLLGPVLEKHFQIYDTLSSEVELSKYWDTDKPLDFFFINYQLEDEENREVVNGKKGGFKATNKFLEAFIQAGCTKILCQFILYLTQYKVSLTSNFLLYIVRSIAMYLETRTEFVESDKFLTAFSDLTKSIFEENQAPIHLFTCIMSWFALFANHKPTLTNKFCSTSMFTIAQVLHEILNKLKEVSSPDEYIRDTFNNELVIETFLDTYKDEPDCLAVQTASRIFMEDDDVAYAQSEEYQLKIEMIGLKDKIQFVQHTNQTSWQLLSILAYLECDARKSEMESAFSYVFHPADASSQDALAILEEQALVSIDKEEYWPFEEHFQVITSVKVWIRLKLIHENNHECLLGVSNFAILETLEGKGKDISNWEHFISLHKYLQNFKWPQNSTHISIIFSLFLTRRSPEGNRSGERLLEDVFEFSKSSHVTNTLALNWSEPEQFRLFQWALFCVALNLNQLKGKHIMWSDPSLSKDKLENTFLGSIKSSIEQFTQLQADLSLTQSYLKRIHMHMLEWLPRVMKTLEPELRTKMNSLILESVNEMNGCHAENILKLFKWLWDFYWESSLSDSVDYLATILRTHFQVYNASFISSTESRLNLYWDKAGPLNLRPVMYACERCSDAEKKKISDCFIGNNGFQIIIDFFSYADEHKGLLDLDLTYLLRFMQMIAYELNCAVTFFETPQFLKKFSKVTQYVLEESRDENENLCMVTWFALFARHCAQQHNSERDFFLEVVAPQLEKLFDFIEFKDSGDESPRNLLLTKDILETFLETFANKSESLAFKTAKKLLDKTQFELSSRAEDNADTDEEYSS